MIFRQKSEPDRENRKSTGTKRANFIYCWQFSTPTRDDHDDDDEDDAKKKPKFVQLCVSVIHEWNSIRMKECGSGRVRVREKERDGASGREHHTCMPSPFCLHCNNTKRQGENCCCFGSWITQLENFGVDFTRHAFKSHLISLSFEL